MADLFTISPDIIATYVAGISALVEQLGKNCTLVYPPTKISCPNCTYDPILKKSNNVWNGTGPVPFSGGICPYCTGIGLSTQNVTKVVKGLLQWSPKDIGRYGSNVEPKDIVKLKTYATNAQDILNATEVIVDSDLIGIANQRCKLLKGPTFIGLQSSKFVVFYFQRIN